MDEEGGLIGVNHASDPAANQYFAIAREEATRIIDIDGRWMAYRRSSGKKYVFGACGHKRQTGL